MGPRGGGGLTPGLSLQGGGGYGSRVGGLVGGYSPPPPRRKSELLHVCTSGSQHKAQKENGLVSGRKDHRYLSVTEDGTRRCQWTSH